MHAAIQLADKASKHAGSVNESLSRNFYYPSHCCVSILTTLILHPPLEVKHKKTTVATPTLRVMAVGYEI